MFGWDSVWSSTEIHVEFPVWFPFPGSDDHIQNRTLHYKPCDALFPWNIILASARITIWLSFLLNRGSRTNEATQYDSGCPFWSANAPYWNLSASHIAESRAWANGAAMTWWLNGRAAFFVCRKTAWSMHTNQHTDWSRIMEILNCGRAACDL